MLAEARQAEAAPAPSPVTPEEVEVLHSVDELTQVLRRRLEATASPHHPSLTEFVRCPHCVQSLLTALDAAKAALEFHRDHHTPALSVARHRGT